MQRSLEEKSVTVNDRTPLEEAAQMGLPQC